MAAHERVFVVEHGLRHRVGDRLGQLLVGDQHRREADRRHRLRLALERVRRHGRLHVAERQQCLRRLGIEAEKAHVAVVGDLAHRRMLGSDDGKEHVGATVFERIDDDVVADVRGAAAQRLDVGVRRADGAQQLAAGELAERADRLRIDLHRQLLVADLAHRADAQLLARHGHQVIGVEPADEGANVVELLRVRLLALVRPAIGDREAEAERCLVLRHEARIAHATGARLDVDVGAGRQRFAQQLRHGGAVHVPGAARVQRCEGQVDRCLRRRAADAQEQRQDPCEDSPHCTTSSSKRRS